MWKVPLTSHMLEQQKRHKIAGFYIKTSRWTALLQIDQKQLFFHSKIWLTMRVRSPSLRKKCRCNIQQLKIVFESLWILGNFPTPILIISGLTTVSTHALLLFRLLQGQTSSSGIWLVPERSRDTFPQKHFCWNQIRNIFLSSACSFSGFDLQTSLVLNARQIASAELRSFFF